MDLRVSELSCTRAFIPKADPVTKRESAGPEGLSGLFLGVYGAC